jgi:hypothetical protein
MTSSDAELAKIQTHFQTLSAAAPALNAASDDLTKAVTLLDEALKKLNVGLSTWVTFRGRGVDDVEYDDDQIGYGKVDGKWGIALRRVWGDYRQENSYHDGPWLFNDAPRELRLLSVDKIPELIEALGKEATDTTKKVQEKAKQVRELASAISEIAKTPPSQQIKPRFTVGTGISRQSIDAILESIRGTRKFIHELLFHVGHWDLTDNVLRLHFSAANQTFAGLLEGRDTLSAVRLAATQVLGHTVRVEPVVDLETPEKSTDVTKGRK